MAEEMQKPGNKGLGTLTHMMRMLTDKDKGAAWKRQRRAALLKKKAQYEKNRAARSAFYSQWRGDKGWNNAGIWHTTLNGLSAGTH